MKRSERDWRDTVALVRTLPYTYPLQVRRCRTPKGIDGDCSLIRDKGPYHFRVRISSKIQEPARTMVLIHEAAHALSWFPDHPRAEHHNAFFGVAYAMLYQAVYET